MTTILQEIFQSILDRHAPIKRKRLRSQIAPWMTPLTRELMTRRDIAKIDAERCPAMWNPHKKLRNQVTKSIREAITLHCQGLMKENKDNPKSYMWKAINKVLDYDSGFTDVSSLEVHDKVLTRSATLPKHSTTIMEVSTLQQLKNTSKCN